MVVGLCHSTFAVFPLFRTKRQQYDKTFRLAITKGRQYNETKVNKIQWKIRQKQPTNSHLICRLLAWPFALFRVRKDDKTTNDKKQLRFSTKTV